MGAIDSPLVLERHRLTADEYQRMGAEGILAPDARVELIEGEIIKMATIGSRHWSMVNRLDELMKLAVGRRAIVSLQSSLRLSQWSEPQPDLALFARRADYYRHALPTPADTLLVIEVADTSARYDREIKLPLYAKYAVRELWIVDLDAKVLRMHGRPEGDGYLDLVEISTPGLTAITALPEVSVDLSGLFDD